MKNTQKSTMWTVRMFTSWADERNKCNNEKCLIEVLCTNDMAELCHWVCVFVKEARQHFINSKSEPTEPLVKLQDTSNVVFRELQNVLEHWFCELHAEGVGTERKQSEIISRSEEEILWEKVYLTEKLCWVY